MNYNLFNSNIYLEDNISWIDNLNKICDKYIEEAIIRDKKYFINSNDFGSVYHSNPLFNDNNFYDFIMFINKKAYSILDKQGYDLKNYYLILNELWVQEFSKKGGGHHSLHTHSKGHISGFYFLKCSDKTSYPIFHDPRPGKMMIQLPEKDSNTITDASEKINFKPKPGTFIFFNSYLGHEFVVDHGIDPFRFIHFNIQAVPKQLINNNYKKINDSKNSSSDRLF
jgi:uncharacterized protein (TIGR02466 family)